MLKNTVVFLIAVFFLKCSDMSQDCMSWADESKTWPNSIQASGVGALNPEIPQGLQVLSAIRAADMVMRNNLYSNIKSLQVTSQKSVDVYMKVYTSLEKDISELILSKLDSTELNSMRDGEVTLSGWINSDRVKELIEEHLKCNSNNNGTVNQPAE